MKLEAHIKVPSSTAGRVIGKGGKTVRRAAAIRVKGGRKICGVATIQQLDLTPQMSTTLLDAKRRVLLLKSKMRGDAY